MKSSCKSNGSNRNLSQMAPIGQIDAIEDLSSHFKIIWSQWYPRYSWHSVISEISRNYKRCAIINLTFFQGQTLHQSCNVRVSGRIDPITCWLPPKCCPRCILPPLDEDTFCNSVDKRNNHHTHLALAIFYPKFSIQLQLAKRLEHAYLKNYSRPI
jgi:hypothetical protein